MSGEMIIDAGAAPPDADELAWRAEELLDRRRIAAARTLLAEALKSSPRHTGLRHALAHADYLEDHHDAAREQLSQLLVDDPEDARARFLLFCVCVEEGELAEAEGLIIELLRCYPAHAPYFAMYSRLMLRALHFEKAGQLADAALRLSPDDALALRARALVDLADDRSGRDNAALVQLVVDDPQDEHTLRLVLVALVDRGRYREARQLAGELLRAYPQDQGLLALAKQTRYLAHWSLLPLWPLQRWGWGATIGLWLIAVLGGRAVGQLAPAWQGLFYGVVLTYVAYSWVWPPLLRKLMKVPA